MSSLEGGPTIAFVARREPQVGAQLEARAGIGWSNREALKTWGFEGSAMMKMTSATQNVALGNGVYFARSTKGGDTTAIVRGGLHLVFERYEEKPFVGAGPYAAITVGVPLASRDFQTTGLFASTWRERTLFTIGPAIEVDARFARATTVTFFGLALGIAWTEENLLIQPNPPRLKPSDPANTPPPY
jgi:hypothetical protein